MFYHIYMWWKYKLFFTCTELYKIFPYTTSCFIRRVLHQIDYILILHVRNWCQEKINWLSKSSQIPNNKDWKKKKKEKIDSLVYVKWWENVKQTVPWKKEICIRIFTHEELINGKNIREV